MSRKSRFVGKLKPFKVFGFLSIVTFERIHLEYVETALIFFTGTRNIHCGSLVIFQQRHSNLGEDIRQGNAAPIPKSGGRAER